MKTYLLSFFLLIIVQGINAQIICDYTHNCGGAPPSSCECFNEEVVPITVGSYGDLAINVLLTHSEYVCCGQTHQGYVRAKVGSDILYNSGVFLFPCVAPGDTYFVTFYGTSGSYVFASSIINQPMYFGDMEPNNNINDASSLIHNHPEEGTINYGNGYDLSDWYRIVAPEKGDLIVYANFDHAGTMAIGGLSVSTDEAGIVELSRSCVAANDTFYVQITHYEYICSGYNLWYNISFSGVDDPEPNGSIEEAIPLAAGSNVSGIVGYGVHPDLRDSRDYYRIVVPQSGDLNVSANFDNGGGIVLYNRTGGVVVPQQLTTTPALLELSKTCVAVNDTFYVRIIRHGGSCGGYDLSYNINNTPSFANDVEPNNSNNFANAISVLSNGTFEGQIGYYSENVYDDRDYYKVIIPQLGDLNVSAYFEKAGALRLYNQYGTQIEYEVTDTPGSLQVSELCIEQGDFFYVGIFARSSICSGYTLDISFVSENAINTNPVLDGSYAYMGDIVTSATIPNGGNVEFIASNAIRMEPGFTAECGTDYTARIGNDATCVPASSMENQNEQKESLKALIKEERESNLNSFITIIPNPSTGYFSLQSNEEVKGSFQVVNINGQVIYESLLQKQKTEVNLNTYESGLYIIHVFPENGKPASKKLLLIK